MTKQRKSTLGYPPPPPHPPPPHTHTHCKPELKETTSWTTVGQAKDIAHQARIHLWKFYVEAVIESEARPAVVQLKNEA